MKTGFTPDEGAARCDTDAADVCATAEALIARYNLDGAWERLRVRLSAKRLEHTRGVVTTAGALALRYGVDPIKAVTAAVYHDWFRGTEPAALNSLIDRYGLQERLKDNENLAHSKLAAAFMERECGIDDEDVLNAVRFHTTGRAGMSRLEKIIFIADATEPGRNFHDVGALRDIAAIDLDVACIFALENTIRRVAEKSEELDPETSAAAQWFKRLRQASDSI